MSPFTTTNLDAATISTIFRELDPKAVFPTQSSQVLDELAAQRLPPYSPYSYVDHIHPYLPQETQIAAELGEIPLEDLLNNQQPDDAMTGAS